MTCTHGNMFRRHNKGADGRWSMVYFEVLAFAMIVIQDFLLY